MPVGAFPSVDIAFFKVLGRELREAELQGERESRRAERENGLLAPGHNLGRGGER
jgi:hypothetical protein